MFFTLSKLLGFFALPSNALISIGLVGLMLLCTRYTRLASWLVVTSLVLIAVAGLSPLGNALILPLEERFTQSLKPMNCPSHHLIYKMGKRSYRELPLRYFTTDVLHRNEASGSLGGLTRVRQFQQDDSHIYLMESQVEEEVARIVGLMKEVYGAFGLPFSARFATRPALRLGRATRVSPNPKSKI